MILQIIASNGVHICRFCKRDPMSDEMDRHLLQKCAVDWLSDDDDDDDGASRKCRDQVYENCCSGGRQSWSETGSSELFFFCI